MSRFLIFALVAGFSPLPLASLAAPPTINPQNQVGLTSYTTMPFYSSVVQSSWGASPYLAPAELFWEYGSFYTNPANQGPARQWAGALAAEGIVPASGAQFWEDTWIAAQPLANFPDAPSWMVQEVQGSQSSNCCSGPEFQQWLHWLAARPALPIMAADGGSMPVQWRPWGGTWGHVSPLTPMPASDCPPDLSACSFGDWFAYRWGQTAAFSGAFGIMLSDFTDSQPYDPSYQQGFNPGIVALFSKTIGQSIPGTTVVAQAAYIASNLEPQWNDYLSAGYGHFYAALERRLSAATGQQALVQDQCSGWASFRRFFGTDQRILMQYINPANYVCIWDDQTMQVGRNGADPAYGVGAYAAAAARTPQMRNGANLEANDPAYWQAIATFNPTLSAADQQERGLKLMKRSWLEGAWAHIADQNGKTRRAMAYMSRDYWDLGTLDPTLQSLVTHIWPVWPFGYALYCSVNVERALEAAVAATDGVWYSFCNPQEILDLKNAGVPIGYYVSDAGLANLQAPFAPAGWIIPEHPELIPAAEMARLTSIAPVVTSAAQALSLADAPISFSNGLTGTAFWDQKGELVITISNPDPSPTAGTVSGFVTLRGIPSGAWTLRNLFTGGSASMIARNKQATLPVSVSRWDTVAYAALPTHTAPLPPPTLPALPPPPAHAAP